MTDGMIFDIQHFCVDDGPGIRSTVFFKGCPLRCIWCHNAEGLDRRRQLCYNSEKCVLCGECAAICKNGCHIIKDNAHCVDGSSCALCGSCADVCSNGAISLVGRRVTAEEALEEVMTNLPFFEESGGGMTLSGGEPLMQPEFAAALAKGAKERGVHVCVETSGHAKTEDILKLAEYTDIFLYDFKHFDPIKHKRLTGVDNRRIMENLQTLNKLKKPTVLRCPIIPGCNDENEHFEAISELAVKTESIIEIHIEPYHPFGVNKYDALGMMAEYDFKEMMPRNDAEKIAENIRLKTEKTVIVT